MDNTSLQVVVLFEGYSNSNEDGSMSANCTCTLIKSPNVNIIVDTMTAWDGAKLEEALKSHNLSPNDIDYVICTHGHSDHIGCNYLFKSAIHIVGFSISHKDKYFEHDFNSGHDYIINETIKVVPTPGHTMQDVSVLVRTENMGIVAITGDLFEKEADLSDDTIWKDAGSDSEKLQIKNRQKILELADYIIPGHGAKFKVPN